MTADRNAAGNVSLVVTCHPDPGSLCGDISERVIATLRQRGATVAVNDLYRDGFNPVPSLQELSAYYGYSVPGDIRGLVADLRSACELIFVLPIWMFAMPAILKGYFDRVWRPHVAFSFDGKDLQPLLVNIEKLTVIATHGRSEAETDQTGEGSRVFFSTSLSALLPSLKSNRRFDFYALDTRDEAQVGHQLNRVIEHLIHTTEA